LKWNEIAGVRERNVEFCAMPRMIRNLRVRAVARLLIAVVAISLAAARRVDAEAALSPNLAGETAIKESARLDKLLQLQEALANRDYDSIYGVEARTAKFGDAEAKYQTGWDLLGGIEIIARFDPKSLYWYRRDLMMKVPLAERFRAGLTWMRRAIDSGWEPAEAFMADAYETGKFDLPRDRELSACFRLAADEHRSSSSCRRMEVSKNYVTEP